MFNFRLFRSVGPFLGRHIAVIFVGLLCLGLGIGLAGTYGLSMKIMDLHAQQNAILSLNALNEATTLHSETVAALKAIEADSLTSNAHFFEIEIPIPDALFEVFSPTPQAGSFRFYSGDPLPHRQSVDGPHDQFERDALQRLSRDPSKPFFRRETVEGQKMFRYADAIRMQASCVECHNTDPSSPKKDWKVGDIAGIVTLSQPLDALISVAQTGIKRIYLVLGLLAGLAILGLMLVLARFRLIQSELEKTVQDKTIALKRLANLDNLTQLPNRYCFDRAFEEEWRRAMRHSIPLSLLICDVDCFQQFHDTYGPLAGDDCLKSVAQVLKKSARRAGEVVARYGGDEFILLLPHVSAEEAIEIAKLIRERFHMRQFTHETSSVQPFITLSIGMASWIPQVGQSSDGLIQAADEALYEAKAQGRDRHILWQDTRASQFSNAAIECPE